MHIISYFRSSAQTCAPCSCSHLIKSLCFIQQRPRTSSYFVFSAVFDVADLSFGRGYALGSEQKRVCCLQCLAMAIAVASLSLLGAAQRRG